jgi:hypothetical protein
LTYLEITLVSWGDVPIPVFLKVSQQNAGPSTSLRSVQDDKIRANFAQDDELKQRFERDEQQTAS